MKNLLTLIYVIGAAIYMLVDWISAYGEDSFLFWMILRPFVSTIKALVWPIMLLV